MVFDTDYKLILKKKKAKSTENTSKEETLICPKCKKGTILKGKTAYGCSAYTDGCDFRYAFDEIRSKAKGKELTKELVFQIISAGL